MPYDPIYAIRDERVRGADTEFKREAFAESMVAISAEESTGKSNEDAGEECGGEGSECGGGV